MGYPNVSMETAITTLVEWILPRSTPEQVLLIRVSASLDYYGEDEEDEEDEVGVSREIHFAIIRPSSYTAVYVAEYDLCQARSLIPRCVEMLNEAEWEERSYHDSCWRFDGIGSSLLEMVNRMYDDIARLTDDKAGRRNTNLHVSFGLTGPKLYKGYMDREAHKPVFGEVVQESNR